MKNSNFLNLIDKQLNLHLNSNSNSNLIKSKLKSKSSSSDSNPQSKLDLNLNNNSNNNFLKSFYDLQTKNHQQNHQESHDQNSTSILQNQNHQNHQNQSHNLISSPRLDALAYVSSVQLPNFSLDQNSNSIYQFNNQSNSNSNSNSNQKTILIDNHSNSKIHDLDSIDQDGRVRAYAKLEFPQHDFYIRKLSLIIGRRPPSNLINSNYSKSIHSSKNLIQENHFLNQSLISKDEEIDVDLGPIRAISRKHATIFYDCALGRWCFEVLGRNGCVVDGRWKARSEIIPLRSRTKIQIAERIFHFILPNLPQDNSSSQIDQSNLIQNLDQNQSSNQNQIQIHSSSNLNSTNQNLFQPCQNLTNQQLVKVNNIHHLDSGSSDEADNDSEPEILSSSDNKSTQKSDPRQCSSKLSSPSKLQLSHNSPTYHNQNISNHSSQSIHSNLTIDHNNAFDCDLRCELPPPSISPSQSTTPLHQFIDPDESDSPSDDDLGKSDDEPRPPSPPRHQTLPFHQVERIEYSLIRSDSDSDSLKDDDVILSSEPPLDHSPIRRPSASKAPKKTFALKMVAGRGKGGGKCSTQTTNLTTTVENSQVNNNSKESVSKDKGKSNSKSKEITSIQVSEPSLIIKERKKIQCSTPPGAEIGTATQKPPYTYASLIAQALAAQADKDGKLLVSEMCEWMAGVYPYYGQKEKGSDWQSAVRHNLNADKRFKRIERLPQDGGKGNFWILKPEEWVNFDGLELKRPKNESKSNNNKSTSLNNAPSRSIGAIARIQSTQLDQKPLQTHVETPHQPQEIKIKSGIRAPPPTPARLEDFSIKVDHHPPIISQPQSLELASISEVLSISKHNSFRQTSPLTRSPTIHPDLLASSFSTSTTPSPRPPQLSTALVGPSPVSSEPSKLSTALLGPSLSSQEPLQLPIGFTGPSQPSPGPTGLVQSSLGPTGPVQSSSGLTGPVQSSLGPTGPVQSSSGPIEPSPKPVEQLQPVLRPSESSKFEIVLQASSSTILTAQPKTPEDLKKLLESEPPMYTKGNQLILNQEIFKELKTHQIETLEKLGSTSAIKILQKFIVEYFKEKIKSYQKSITKEDQSNKKKKKKKRKKEDDHEDENNKEGIHNSKEQINHEESQKKKLKTNACE
ncbi:hypothetical protein O181_080380 [Austropuccinia psidii MF-1]|uniref:Fork-head domain-containing protein n=1 Tax=Austropuccinia psidii MF-1 TaxID=1389203 RepID=A0A9Q3FN34_9BASI|nr:hypothetical protein [Austropuccinia psidii MF-1]